MLRSSLVCLCAMLLLLLGVQLASVVFLLAPSYAAYYRDTESLDVDLRHVFVGDHFTNVGTTFCLLHPVPLLCSFGGAHDLCHTHNLRAPQDFRSTAMYAQSAHYVANHHDDSTMCSCLADVLVAQHVFFGQLGYSIPPTYRIMDFLSSSPLTSAASRFARDHAPSDDDSPVPAEIVATLGRVDAASCVARRAVEKMVAHADFVTYRACFAHHVAFSALRIAAFVDRMFPSFHPFESTETTLCRLIGYLIQVTVASAEMISTDAANAVEALDSLLVVISVDAFDTLLHAYSSFTDHRQAIRHCAMDSSASSPVCLAVDMLLHNVSMVEFMRDELVALKETVEHHSKGLGDHPACASTSQWCMLGAASQLLLSSQAYLSGWGRHGIISASGGI